MALSRNFIFTLACPDRAGIVARVTTLLASANLNIIESSQFGDVTTQTFFMRTVFAPTPNSNIASYADVEKALSPLGKELAGEWHVYDTAKKPRVLLMVSKIGHALNDLLFRHSSGQLDMEIPLVVSNHDTFKALAASYNIPFVHIPVTSATKVEAEDQLLSLIKENNIELVVLARYMQIMSSNFCTVAPPTINCHHALLPAFQGGKAYHQAYDKGVKMIGATAHFASADLDEGPIIEQDIGRVNHNMTPKDLTHIGSTIENTVLARAVRWWCERRVFVNGQKTVVFS